MSHSSFSTVQCIYSGLPSKYLLTTSGEDHWRSNQCGQANMTEKGFTKLMKRGLLSGLLHNKERLSNCNFNSERNLGRCSSLLQGESEVTARTSIYNLARHDTSHHNTSHHDISQEVRGQPELASPTVGVKYMDGVA